VFPEPRLSFTRRSSGTASRRVLLLIAAFKLLKAVVLLAGGIGALNLLNPDRAASVQGWLEGLALDRVHHMAAAAAGRALALLDLAGPDAIHRLAAGAFLLSAVFAVEGVGLAFARRWAEYLTVAVTISFLPLEAVALWHRWTAARAGTAMLNLAVVIFLVARIAAVRPIKDTPPPNSV
jgi:uncharacterized membrane protein (DUF2068 family)